jgi:S-adenosyl methyltransferase
MTISTPAADREAAEQAIAANPGIVADVRANRAFLVRVVRYLASECGILSASAMAPALVVGALLTFGLAAGDVAFCRKVRFGRLVRLHLARDAI